MKKSITTNYIFNVSYQILLLIVPIVTAPYLARVLGAEGVGTYSYAYAMASYFTLIAVMGTSTFGQRSISYVQDDIQSRSNVFWEVFITRLILVSVAVLLYIVYVKNVNKDKAIMIILGLNIVNVAVDVSWFFQGMEEFSRTVIRSFIFKILQVIFIFLFVKKSSDLALYVLGTSLLTVLGSASLWAYLPKYIKKPTHLCLKKNIRPIIELFIPTIAIQVYTVLDKTMIGWFSINSLENGYYEQAEKIVKICMTLITSLGTVMLPRMASTFKSRSEEKFKQYLYVSYRFVFLLGFPMMFGLIAVADNFTMLFFGPGYDKVQILLPMFSSLVLIIPLGYVTGGQYLVATGKQNLLSKFTILGAIVNVSLNLLLIPKYFSIGATVSSVLAELCVTVAGLFYLVRIGEIDLKKLWGDSKFYFIASLLMSVILFLEKSVFANGIWKLVGMIFTGTIVYFLCLLFFKDELFFRGMEYLGNVSSRLQISRKGEHEHED